MTAYPFTEYLTKQQPQSLATSMDTIASEIDRRANFLNNVAN